MENKTIIIVQARLTSTRFPNKILKKIGNDTLIEILLKRLSLCKAVDQIVLAIPGNKKNKILSKILKSNIPVFYGSENDVLDRYYKAAKKFKATYIVRISGDCPLIDPKVIDKAVDFFKTNKFDYVSNTIKPTYPDGLDVEVFTMDILNKAYNNAERDYHHEHVTPWIYENSNNIKYISDLDDFSDFRLTLDTLEDYLMIVSLAERLSNVSEQSYSALKAVLEVAHDLKSINKNIVQKKVKL